MFTRRFFRNFDFVAPVYPLLETASFGNSLNEARGAFLDCLAGATHVLLIGEGNGRFLAQLLACKRGGSVSVVDSSPRMQRLLSKRVSRIERSAELRLITADFLSWNSEETRYDAVVTHFFLDLFRPSSQLHAVRRITDLAKPDALWINVDFRQKKTKRIHRLIDWLQYRFDEIFSGVEADRLYDPADHIKSCGWRVEEERLFCSGSVFAQALKRSREIDLNFLRNAES